MAVSADFQAQADAWGKQYDQQQDAEAAKQNPSAAQVLPTSVFHWMDSNRFGRMTLSGIDDAVGTAENIWNSSSQVVRKGRDVASGALTGATNIEDAVQSAARTATNAAANSSSPMLQAAGTLGQEFMQHVENPIWSHAKESVLDFRDAVAVKDPTMSDDLTQAAAQLAIPYLGYSRILGGMMDVAKAGAAARFGTDMAAGAATDATALQPHAMRTADLIALGRHTEGKLGEVLRRIAPDGSALNAYINYLADNKNETEAQGRFKNVLDGLTANMIFTPLLHAAGITIKQGAAGMRYLVDNGVGSAAGLGPPSLARQAGKIVFHGTPHDFDEFSNDKIGSGEGHQTYGHGLYFAENPDTAGHYKRILEAKRGSGRLMHVDIPDEKIDQMLDHDQLIGKQPHVLAKIPEDDQAGLLRMLDDHHQDGELEDFTGNEFRQMVQRAINEGYIDFMPRDGNYDNPSKVASEYLSDHGIPGIKYLDSGSRADGGDTRNIVLFNARDAKLVKKE